METLKLAMLLCGLLAVSFTTAENDYLGVDAEIKAKEEALAAVNRNPLEDPESSEDNEYDYLHGSGSGSGNGFGNDDEGDDDDNDASVDDVLKFEKMGVVEMRMVQRGGDRWGRRQVTRRHNRVSSTFNKRRSNRRRSNRRRSNRRRSN